MISVKVPASTANLGPGFDCMGMALGLYNSFEISIGTDRLLIETENNQDGICRNEDNLVFKSIRRLYQELGKEVPPLKIKEKTGIPISRGLGSSASCIVAGLVAANNILDNPFSRDKLLEFASEIEGHPDNVAPALMGGFVISAATEDGIRYVRHEINNNFKLMAMIPGFTLSTSSARSVLPKNVSLSDAVFNISRSCLLTACLLTGNFKNLKYAVQDKLHQQYRLKLIPDGEKVLCMAYESGCSALFISGSGPTLMAVIDETEIMDKMQQFCNTLKTNWEVRLIETDNCGTVVNMPAI